MYEQLKLDNQICFRLYTASRLVTQAYRPLLEPLGLTYPQYLVMMVLWEKDNLTINEIGKRLMLESNTLTPLLQRMERQGLIARTRSAVDARQMLVCLTKQGKHLEKEAQNVPTCMSHCLHGAPLGDNEASAFVGVLDNIIKTLNTKQ